MTDEDGFGPPLRGGGGHSPRGVGVNPRPRPKSRSGGHSEHSTDDGFGPPSGGKASRVRRGGPRRVLKILALVILLLVLAAVGTGIAAALSANAQITRVGVQGLEPVRNGQRNILLVGSDDREGLTRRQRRRLGTGNFTGNRTDTILLLTIRGSKGAMLSFPRDLYVERCDGTAGRINGAYGIDGASCLVRTVSAVSGIPVTQFLEVDFLGFHDIVEAVGGVRMCLKEPIKDRDAHIDLPKGCQRLNGKESLGFVRVRKIDNDLGRIERQQRFLKELAKSAAQPSTVLNPLTLFSTGNAVGRALTADRGLGVLDLAALARAGVAMGRTDFPTMAVPADPTFVGGAAVLAVNDARAEPVFRSFRDGTILEQVGSTVVPEDVSLVVRNGAGVPGLAQAAAARLSERGFDVTGVGNAAATDQTVVRYRKGQEEAAQLVAEHVPGADLQQVDGGPQVALIIGTDTADAIGQ
ncbi:MAG: hypothetical protein GEU74_16220 [Nitriliruptorales bacterium]|nr:hypothetical protein [Nitriliruptorales bacterium]